MRSFYHLILLLPLLLSMHVFAKAQTCDFDNLTYDVSQCKASCKTNVLNVPADYILLKGVPQVLRLQIDDISQVSHFALRSFEMHLPRLEHIAVANYSHTGGWVEFHYTLPYSLNSRVDIEVRCSVLKESTGLWSVDQDKSDIYCDREPIPSFRDHASRQKDMSDLVSKSMSRSSCRYSDSLQLVSLYNATNGGSWYYDQWDLSQPIDTWYGVFLNSAGCVIGLDLSSTGLYGTLPPLDLPSLYDLNLDQNDLYGELPSLSGLPNLVFMSIEFNQFYGYIPSLTNLAILREINLRFNYLQGPLPDLSQNTDLSSIDLSWNFFINDTLPSFAANTNLEYIDLSYNRIEGPLQSFEHLTALKSLLLGHNELTGSVPSFANNIALENLELDDNGLAGPIPDLSQNTALKRLDLSDNGFEGALPQLLENTALTDVKLSGNNFSGTIPEYALHPDLSWLDLSDNNLSGTIPSFDNNAKLRLLYLDENNLSGTMPSFDNNSDLRSIDLSSNQLTGSIPIFANTPELSSLDCSHNRLSGSIPDFQYIPELGTFYCAGNNLSGDVPNFSGTPDLQRFDCSDNRLSGSVPDFTSIPDLFDLDMSENDMTGEVPDFGAIPNLWYLDLSDNQLTGTLPDFTSLPNLYELDVSNNQLTGTMPTFHLTPNLREVDLSYNQYDSTVPNYAAHCPSMEILAITDNHLTFTDILPCHDSIRSFIDEYNYDWQEEIYPNNGFALNVGDDLLINVPVDTHIIGNVYHWYKDDRLLYASIDIPTFEIVSVDLEDAGTYRVTINNGEVPDLTLRSYDIPVSVNMAVLPIVGLTDERIRGLDFRGCVLGLQDGESEILRAYFSTDTNGWEVIDQVSVSYENPYVTVTVPETGYLRFETDRFSSDLYFLVDDIVRDEMLTMPNPVHGTVHYPIEVQVYNMTGERVASGPDIHYDHLPGGLYLLKYRDGLASKTVKIINL